MRNLQAQIGSNCQPPLPVFADVLHWPGKRCLLTVTFQSAHGVQPAKAGTQIRNIKGAAGPASLSKHLDRWTSSTEVTAVLPAQLLLLCHSTNRSCNAAGQQGFHLGSTLE